MSVRIPQWIKPFVWGAIAGAIVLAVVEFKAGWVVTSGTANEQARSQAQQAVAAALTPVCVEQFKKLAPEKEASYLAALNTKSRYQRRSYVEDQGWASMPGTGKPNDDLADACVKQLLKLGAQ